MRSATPDDAPAIATLRTAAADDLTARFGKGHWSLPTSVKSAITELKSATVLIAGNRNKLIATVRLAPKKPWAIDTSYFAVCHNPLYLTNMAVAPASQGKGIGRACIDSAVEVAQSHGADAIRLDAYDAEAGAGGFYEKCGFRETGRVTYRNVPLIYLELMLGELK
jgi:ribosomal protein S18 acetylase RimI-like enzyme